MSLDDLAPPTGIEDKNFDELRARQAAALAELKAVREALNTGENRRIAYEFIQVMNETGAMVGNGYVSLLEFTSKGTIRATVPMWGGQAPGVYHFNRRILESGEFRAARIAKIAAKRARRDERRRLAREEAERAEYEKLHARFGGAAAP